MARTRDDYRSLSGPEKAAVDEIYRPATIGTPGKGGISPVAERPCGVSTVLASHLLCGLLFLMVVFVGYKTGTSSC